LLADFDLELAGIADRLAVEHRDDVTGLETGFGAGGIGFDLRDYSTFGFLQIEELRVLGSDIADADTHVAVADFTVANESVDGRLHNLGRDGEAHAGECAGAGDEEGVDADDLTVSVHQRSTG